MEWTDSVMLMVGVGLRVWMARGAFHRRVLAPAVGPERGSVDSAFLELMAEKAVRGVGGLLIVVSLMEPAGFLVDLFMQYAAETFSCGGAGG